MGSLWIQNKGFPTGGHHVGPDAVVEKVFKRFAMDWQSWRFDGRRVSRCGRLAVPTGANADDDDEIAENLQRSCGSRLRT